MAHLCKGMLELWSTEPVLTEKCFRQSLHLKGMGLRLAI